MHSHPAVLALLFSAQQAYLEYTRQVASSPLVSCLLIPRIILPEYSAKTSTGPGSFREPGFFCYLLTQTH